MVKDGQRCELAVGQGLCLLGQASIVSKVGLRFLPRVLWRFKVVRQAEAEVGCQYSLCTSRFPCLLPEGCGHVLTKHSPCRGPPAGWMDSPERPGAPEADWLEAREGRLITVAT